MNGEPDAVGVTAVPAASGLDLALPRARAVVGAVVLGVAYAAAATLGFALTLRPVPVSTLWLPNAIGLAACVLTPPRSWWLLLAAVLPAHLAVELGAGVPLPMALCWFVSNAAEALLGAILIRRVDETPFRLDSFANVWRFLIYVTLIPVAVSCFLDAAFVQLNRWGSGTYWEIWSSRFRSNALATLTVVPMVLGWGAGGLAALRGVPRSRYVEAVLLGAALLAVSVVAFGWRGESTVGAPALLYAPLLVLLWAAVRFGPTGVSTALVVVVLLAVWSAAHGRGPFLSHSPNESALAMQALFGGISVVMLALAAVVEERRRALEMATFRGEKLQLALDGAQMGVWIYRNDAGVIELSPEASRILGTEDGAKVVSIKRFLAAIHPDDRRGVASAMWRAVNRGTSFELEFRMGRRSGASRWVLGKGRVLAEPGQRPASLVGLCADITPRKQGEAISTLQRRILEMIATEASCADVLDEVLRLIEAESPGMIGSVLLLDGDGVHARHCAAPNLPSDFTSAIDGVAIGATTGSFGAAMHRRRPVFATDVRTDPKWRPFRAAAAKHGLRAAWASPILSEQGEVLGSFTGYFREPRSPGASDLRLVRLTTRLCAMVLERKRLEIEADERQREVAHLGRVVMLGELAGTLAHEINQPLSAILSSAQAGQHLLQRRSSDLAELGEIFEDIVEADHRANEVVERLRSMIRKEHPPPGVVDLNEVVTSTLELVRRDLLTRTVVLVTRLAPDLPLIVGDRIQLQQVLLNLLFNACEAMSAIPPGTRLLVVETGSDASGCVAELLVTDSGPGIPVEPVERVFEPFFTLKKRGLGLGLAICRSIVLKHQGRLWAENGPHGGATLHVVLPASTGDAS
jgi:PAS domain S-box-containing protein